MSKTPHTINFGHLIEGGRRAGCNGMRAVSNAPVHGILTSVRLVAIVCDAQRQTRREVIRKIIT